MSIILAEHPAVTRQRLQRRLSDLIERLIATLDGISDDPDLEDGADPEPSLSFGLGTNQDEAIRGEPLGTDWIDAEDACEDEGGEHDGREPEDGF